jgi:hypothetical protein
MLSTKAKNCILCTYLHTYKAADCDKQCQILVGNAAHPLNVMFRGTYMYIYGLILPTYLCTI